MMRKPMRHTRHRSLRFWLVFWLSAALLLGAWWLFLNRDDMRLVANALFGTHAAATAQRTPPATAPGETTPDALPRNATLRDNAPLSALMRYIMQRDGKERTFLVLLQNNMELRPGGGYIGSFGIVRIRDGALVGAPEVHDTSNFDGRIPDDEAPPYPLEELLGIPSWKFRDSNWSPDFAVNAQTALHFYYKGQGSERFDGVIGVTADVLRDLLELTGPIRVPGYAQTFDAAQGIRTLEYQVEQGFAQQGLSVGERKSIMPLLAKEITERINLTNPVTLVQLFMRALHALERKDIQVYFVDDAMQAQMRSAGWTGEVDTRQNGDYLMIVDANIGALKTDAVMRRSAHYSVDMTQDTPRATLELTYTNTATQRDYMTSDYRSYTRVYLPDGAWITGVDGAADAPRFGHAFGKKFVGFLVETPLNSTRKVVVRYTLPTHLRTPYRLTIQKQAGATQNPFIVDYTAPDGTTTRLLDQPLESDVTLTAK